MKLLEFKTAYSYQAFVDVDEVISASYYNGILSIVFKNGQKMDYHMSQSNVAELVIHNIMQEKETIKNTKHK